MTATVLITGATGSLGPAVVADILRRDASVIILFRPGRERPDLRLDPRERAVFDQDRDMISGQLTFVPGDLSQPHVALAIDDRRRLARHVTHVLHLAADTRFSLPLPQARERNLDTTLALLRLVTDFDRLQALGFASTLYVAGTRTGEILEGDLADTGFVNTYEHAKFETEQALRTRMADLPIAVYRMATLLGSARTGEVRKPTAIHHALRLYHRGLVPMIPGDPSQPLELLDVEHASEAMARLLLDAFAPGTAYHLTAGPERSFTLAELIEKTHRHLGELDTGWAQRGIEPPAIVSSRAYALFERTVREAADPAMTAIVRSLSTFLPQLMHPKRFDRRNTAAALPDWDPPHVREYYRLVLAHCLRAGWFSRDAETKAAPTPSSSLTR